MAKEERAQSKKITAENEKKKKERRELTHLETGMDPA